MRGMRGMRLTFSLKRKSKQKETFARVSFGGSTVFSENFIVCSLR